MKPNEREELWLTWVRAYEQGECTCELRAAYAGLVTERDDKVPVDPDCEHHGHLIGECWNDEH